TGLQYKAADLKAISTLLAPQTLKPGSQAAGTIVFEVPEKAAGLELQFSAGHQRALWSTAG
ncbi:MAG: DUF4352 domain-containing protein, partial [Anaerolineales bacterium]|nr:DUF4352 domain-containing protein [Anaerolineales bacterium]